MVEAIICRGLVLNTERRGHIGPLLLVMTMIGRVATRFIGRTSPTSNILSNVVLSILDFKYSRKPTQTKKKGLVCLQ